MLLHIDMDAFYASVEEREQPSLRGKPLAVGGLPSARGVVAAANYAAREFGVRSALPSATAMRRCPQLIILPPRGELYAAVSAQILEIFGRYTPVIEPLSLDEAFLDPSGSERLHGDAEQIGRAIKTAVKTELGLVASVGVGANKFLAKLASGWDKPDGFTVIRQHQAQALLDPLPVERLWGVGKAAKSRLNRDGIHSVAQLRRAGEPRLVAAFGSTGARLWQLAHGIDHRAVTADSEVKSISQETTFATDITAPTALHATAMQLADAVAYRLRRNNLHGKTITLKIRFHDFTTITRSRSHPQPTNATIDIRHLTDELLQRELRQAKISVRLLGVAISNLTPPTTTQTNLLPPNPKQTTLDTLTDQIQTRHGKTTIHRG